MIGALIAFAAISTGAPSGPEVAFTARLYYPYPDNRVSKSQVYICSFDGKGRRQLTTGSTEPAQIAWVSKQKLCWTEVVGGKHRLVLYNLASKRKSVLLSGSEAFSMVGTYDLFKPTSFPEYENDRARYRVTNDGLKRIEKAALPSFGGFGLDGQEWQIPGEPVIGFVSYRDDEATKSARFPHNDSIYIFERAGRRYEWRLEGSFFQFFKADTKGCAYLHVIDGGASAGTWEFLHEINWETGKLRRLVSGVHMLRLTKGSSRWTALEGGRQLSKYGPEKMVWTKTAIVGDIAKGKRWSIASGLVECYDIALAPGG
ncbi:MAG: hypothetical protein M3R13_07985 [Armatimonadota bacterium]|nr:hypothetical protein [Armatimonadota bacterium]